MTREINDAILLPLLYNHVMICILLTRQKSHRLAHKHEGGRMVKSLFKRSFTLITSSFINLNELRAGNIWKKCEFTSFCFSWHVSCALHVKINRQRLKIAGVVSACHMQRQRDYLGIHKYYFLSSNVCLRKGWRKTLLSQYLIIIKSMWSYLRGYKTIYC